MSTLKVDGIRSNSASSDAITLASDGTCTANITNNLSNRNKIINGAMNVKQRGTSFTATSGYTLDRWLSNSSNDGAWAITHTTTAPPGFGDSLKVDCTTTDTSLAAGQFAQINHRIEAQNLQDLAFGTSSAKTITLSFWVRSNKTGNFTVAIQQNDNSSKQVSSVYAINTADTWEKKTITYAGDTSGVINNDNGQGLQISWNLAIGSTYTSGTARAAWTAYADGDFAAGHNVNLLDNTANEWLLSGVQLEVGSVATDFEHRSYAQELLLCQRYYAVGGIVCTTGTPERYTNKICLPVDMRAVPTRSVGGIDNGSGATISPNYTTGGANSKRDFYQGANNSAVSAGWFIFDAEF